MGKHDRKREGALSHALENEPDKGNPSQVEIECSRIIQLTEEKARQHPRVVLLLVILLLIFVIAVPWFGLSYAEVFLSIYKVLFISVLVAALLKVFIGKKGDIPQGKVGLVILAMLLCVLCTFNAGFAEAHYKEDAEKNSSTVEAGGDTPESSTIEQEEEPSEPVEEIPEVEMDEDFLVYYCNIGDNGEMAKQIARKFVEKYRDGNLPYPRKPAEELRGGDYGDCMDAANKDHKVVDLDTEPDVKLNAVKSEIEERETADEISAEPDNLVLLGDLYLMRLDLESLDPDERIKVYHDAIRCYWKALQVWNSEGPGPYSDGWNRIYEAYTKMGQDPIIESPHQKRAEWLAKIFEEILQEERERAGIFSNSK